MSEDLEVTVTVPEDRSVRAVRLTENLRVYPWFTAHATGTSLPFDVDIQARFDDGRYRVEQLTATKRPKGEAVTTDGLRQIPVGRIMRQAVDRVVIGDALAQFGVAIAGKDRWTALMDSDLYLVMVATLYRLAHAVNVPPTAYVAERLGLAKSTAGRYVGLARSAGHLGPALGTKAGEA